MPEFQNTPNQPLTLESGEVVWVSRSIVVTACVLVRFQSHNYVLINQRGTGLENDVGLWNMPCGYLDYGENIRDSAIREVWEECGVDVNPLLAQALVAHFDEVWAVDSQPTGSKQNVKMHHGCYVEVGALPNLTNQYNEPNETMDIRWLRVEELSSLKFAFGHDALIKHYLDLVERKLAHK